MIHAKHTNERTPGRQVCVQRKASTATYVLIHNHSLVDVQASPTQVDTVCPKAPVMPPRLGLDVDFLLIFHILSLIGLLSNAHMASRAGALHIVKHSQSPSFPRIWGNTHHSVNIASRRLGLLARGRGGGGSLGASGRGLDDRTVAEAAGSRERDEALVLRCTARARHALGERHGELLRADVGGRLRSRRGQYDEQDYSGVSMTLTLSPFLVTVAAVNVFPTPVPSTFAVTWREPSVPLCGGKGCQLRVHHGRYSSVCVRVKVRDRGDEGAVRLRDNGGRRVEVLRNVDAAAGLGGRGALHVGTGEVGLHAERGGDTGVRVRLEGEPEEDRGGGDEALGEEHGGGYELKEVNVGESVKARSTKNEREGVEKERWVRTSRKMRADCER